MALPRLALYPAAALAMILAGCSPENSKITAHTQMDFDMWLSDESQHLPADELRVIKEAEQEIKLQIMATTNLHGSDAISSAYFDKVDGLTLSQYVKLGLDARIQRLTADRDQAKQLYSDNSKIRTRPGDTASQDYLQARVNEDQSRLDRDEADLASTRADQAKYGSGAPASP